MDGQDEIDDGKSFLEVALGDVDTAQIVQHASENLALVDGVEKFGLHRNLAAVDLVHANLAFRWTEKTAGNIGIDEDWLAADIKVLEQEVSG